MGWYAEHVFPWILDHVEGPELVALRGRCVAPARGDVLEVGFGTGKTLPFYTSAVDRLTVLEPSPGMLRRARAGLREAPVPVDVRRGVAEALPFPDDRFDEVVFTMTLCSVPDPDHALAEARRVLRPDGRLRVLEHVRSTRPGVARRQRLFNPIQRLVACGCHLDRDTGAAIERAGFIFVEQERLLTKDAPSIDHALFPLLLGVARPQ